MRALIVLLLLAAAACAHVDATAADIHNQAPFGVVTMGNNIGYLIDSRTESCVLVYAQSAATQVDCAKLRRNVPEAAKYITWL